MKKSREGVSQDACLPRAIVSSSIGALLLWLLASISIPQFENSQLRMAFLRVAAKCPGLPYGQNSGGPDYINIAIDVALAAIAGVFIFLTIRDVRRKRRLARQESAGSEEEL